MMADFRRTLQSFSPASARQNSAPCRRYDPGRHLFIIINQSGRWAGDEINRRDGARDSPAELHFLRLSLIKSPEWRGAGRRDSAASLSVRPELRRPPRRPPTARIAVSHKVFIQIPRVPLWLGAVVRMRTLVASRGCGAQAVKAGSSVGRAGSCRRGDVWTYILHRAVAVATGRIYIVLSAISRSELCYLLHNDFLFSFLLNYKNGHFFSNLV